MDIDPGPGCRIFAAIELSMGSADMRIVQACADRLEELEHLWRRPPFGLLDTCAHDAGDTIAEVRSLLEGFYRAARDYGVDFAYLVIDGLDAWREAFTALADELGLRVAAPDERRRADMVLAAAARRLGGESGRRAFIIPGGAHTCVVSDDGKYFFRLPMGMDRGYFCELLALARRGERRQLRRKGDVDAQLLLRDAARACARYLPASGMEQYRLYVCMDFPVGIIEECDCTGRQLAGLGSDLSRRAAEAGAGLCYALEESDAAGESYSAYSLRRAHNALCLAEAVCARLGAAGISIVNVSARDAILAMLGVSGAELADAGRDAELARRGAECYAGAHGGNAVQSARVATAARMMLLALSGAFGAHELPAAEELIALAAALGDCLSIESGALARDVGRLPGLGARAREMLVRICSVERDAVNDAVFAALMPERTADARENELFSGDALADEAIAGDEFASGEYDDVDYGAEDGVVSGGADDDFGRSDDAPANDEVYGGNNVGSEAPADGRPVRDVYSRLCEHAQGMPLELRVTALLSLARALNMSGRERLSGLSARLGGRGLMVRASLRESAVLETLEFKYRAELFERVFGIKARLKLDKRSSAR